MTPETERMSAVDAAWLRMDRPTNLMMIVGVVVFDSRVDFRRFRRTIEERFLGFTRFRCRPSLDAVTAEWIADPDFDLTPDQQQLLYDSGYEAGRKWIRKHPNGLPPRPTMPKIDVR